MKKTVSKIISLIMALAIVIAIIPIGTIEAEAAAAYPKISALKVPRIYQPSSDKIGMCHFNSIACLIAFKKGSYTYGNLSRTYSYGTDYEYSSDPIWNKMFDDCNNCYDPILNNYYTKYPGNIVTENVTGNNTQTYKIIYEQLSMGNPVVIYGSGSPNHASVVIGYSASTNSLDASKFCVMQITKSSGYWPNSKSNFDTYANSPTTSHSKSCYLTLSAWMSYNDITLNRISYYKDPGVEIDKSYKEYSVSKTNAVLCGKVMNPKLKSLGKCGIKLYDASGNLLKECSESISGLSSYSVVNLYYNVNTELKYTLKEGTTYKYQFYAVVNGKTYYSSTETFTTTGGTTSYSLSYNANGGSGAPSSQSGATSYTVSSTVPTRSGYTFLGWSTNAYATSPDYYGGEEISIDHDVTLYAIWEESEYTVTFYGNGGTGVPDAERFYPGDSITIPEEIPSFTGYTFSGWSETADFSSTVYYPGDEVYFDSSTNLFAIWREFGAYEGYTGLDFTREQPHYIMKFVPEKTGEYVIKTTTVDEPVDTVGTLADSNNVLITENDDSDDDGNFKISYNFTKGKTYYIYVRTFNGEEGYVGLTVMPTATITYDANGGYDAPETQAHDIDYFISDDEPYRDGYEFIGWSEQRGADEASYYPGEDITVTENITLYAVWDKLASEFYVRYNANGGTNAPQAQFVGSNSIGYIPDEVPVRDGYEFTGWCVNLNGTGTWYYPGDMIRRSDDQEDITLYAMWEATEAPDPDPDPDPEPFGLVEIKTPSITTIRYGDSIILRANINNSVFDSLKITWEASNENFKVVSVSDDGKQCIITPVKSGETTFTAKIKMGNTVLDFDMQVMTAKAGFFDKLIAFFKMILGIGGTVYQQTISLYK